MSMLMRAPFGSWLKGLASRLGQKEAPAAPGEAVDVFRREVVAELATYDPRMARILDPLLTAIERGRVKPPLLPAVSLEMLQMARDPNVSFDKIARLAVTDPTVAARIMKVASSAAIGGTIPPKGVKDGLVRLGIGGIQQVAFELAFSSKTVRRGPHVRLVERTVRHARCASALCRLLARDLRLHAGTAALAGLVHGLGGIVIIDQLSDRRRLAKATGKPDFVLPGFLVYLSVTQLHPLVTSQISTQFGLDPVIAKAIEQHHGDLTGVDDITRLLLLADLLSPGEPGARAMPVAAALERCGLQLDERLVRERLFPLTAMFEELRQSLDVTAANAA
jgi:HD-like signal output (HDOD) protein